MKDFGENNNLISIIVPVYNASRFLSETIETVQKQTYTDWELLLVDDCSKDDSVKIAREYAVNDTRVRSIVQEYNQGAAQARNRGVKEARGRYICYLDADDIWESDKLQKQIKYVQDNNIGFCFTGYEFADENAVGLGKIVKVPETIDYNQALKNTTIFTSTVMFDRTIIEDEDICMPQIASEDTATWWKVLKKYGKGYGLDLNLVRYRRTANTLSSNKFEAIKRIWNLYRKYAGLSFIKSAYCMCLWALRAVFRRI